MRSRPECPQCGYDLSGTVVTWNDVCPLEGRCSECGAAVWFADAMAAGLHRPTWFWGAGSRRGPLRFVATWARALWPPGFWSRLRIQDLATSRALVWTTIVFVLPRLVQRSTELVYDALSGQPLSWMLSRVRAEGFVVCLWYLHLALAALTITAVCRVVGGKCVGAGRLLAAAGYSAAITVIPCIESMMLYAVYLGLDPGAPKAGGVPLDVCCGLRYERFDLNFGIVCILGTAAWVVLFWWAALRYAAGAERPLMVTVVSLSIALSLEIGIAMAWRWLWSPG